MIKSFPSIEKEPLSVSPSPLTKEYVSRPEPSVSNCPTMKPSAVPSKTVLLFRLKKLGAVKGGSCTLIRKDSSTVPLRLKASTRIE